MILKEAEDGKFIESIIGDNNFILQLKDPLNKLGILMEVNYFIGQNFEALKQGFEELDKLNKEKIKELFKVQYETDLNESKKSEKKIKKSNELKTLKDFEDTYLFHGKFVYPDSLPFHSYTMGKNLK